jgi:hypothetical protein
VACEDIERESDIGLVFDYLIEREREREKDE